MGQQPSKGVQMNAGYPPFENYQGAAAPGLVTSQYPPPGGRVVRVTDEPFFDQDPVFVPESHPPPRTARGNFAPPRGIPRRQPPYGPPDSIVNTPGYAAALRDQMMIEAAEEAPRYRSAPPQSRPPPQRREPYIKTVRTVINEPRGYAPPGSQTQQQSYQVQSQQQGQQPTNVLYYDPHTGQLSSSGQQHSMPTGPVSCGTQSCAAPQVQYQQQAAPQVYQQAAPQVMYQQQAAPQVAYQPAPQMQYQVAPQMMGYQQQPQVVGAPQMFGYQQQPQQVAYAYPQQQAMTQPIVVPGQLYTANGGVQQLG